MKWSSDLQIKTFIWSTHGIQLNRKIESKFIHYKIHLIEYKILEFVKKTDLGLTQPQKVTREVRIVQDHKGRQWSIPPTNVGY